MSDQKKNEPTESEQESEQEAPEAPETGSDDDGSTDEPQVGRRPDFVEESETETREETHTERKED